MWGLGDRAQAGWDHKGQGWAKAGMRGSVYPRNLPALQVAEIQKIELSVILGMVDSVHILGEVELAHICSPPPWPPPTRSHLPTCQVPAQTHPLHLFTAVQPIVVTQGSVGLREATCGAGDGLAP